MLNILSIGIASYNFKMRVASDIPTNGYYIPNGNTKSQEFMRKKLPVDSPKQDATQQEEKQCQAF